MDVEALRRSPVGTLVPISGVDPRTGEHYDHWAFLPAPLPATVALTDATWSAIVDAETALARLDQAARQVREPALLRRPTLRREAQSTSALEGTYAPFVDVLDSSIEDRRSASAELREILNYVVAAEYGFDWIRERRFSIGLIADLQRTLVEGTAGEHDDAGQLRNRQVVIGPPGGSVVNARFVPPPAGDQLRGGVEAWLEWINDPPLVMRSVVRAALAHYQFETLHPFSDGNGRIGRLLVVLQFMREGVLHEPILVVSPWFEARRAQYQDGLLAVSTTGDWDSWIRFFSEGVAAAATATRGRIDALLAWSDEAVERVRRGGVSGVAERLAGELIGAPMLRAPLVADRHNVSQQGAIYALRRLVQLGILRESRRAGRPWFVADEVVEILAD